MERNKKLWIGIIVVIILLVIFWAMNKSFAPAPETGRGGAPLFSANPATLPTEDISPGSINLNAKKPTISYEDALAKYSNTLLYIDEGCKVSPANLTVKNNTDIMIDNRTSAIQVVKVGMMFPIKANSFKLVKLSSATLPATWLMDCGKMTKVASILIEK